MGAVAALNAVLIAAGPSCAPADSLAERAEMLIGRALELLIGIVQCAPSSQGLLVWPVAVWIDAAKIVWPGARGLTVYND